nr:receptor-like protein 9DC1 [Ziziphus jujuba var. spinosa]
MLLLLFLSSSVSSSSISLSSSPSPIPSPPLCYTDDSNALHQFKNSFSIIDYNNNYCGHDVPPMTISWKIEAWSGVTCNNITGHVISLDLNCGMLQGTIHSNSSLFLLGHLQSLILSGNDFRGSTIPPEFGKLVDLLNLEISKALLQFKNSFSIHYTFVDYCGPHVPPPTISWKSGTDCCGWSGVTCNNITGHVIGLNLTCSMLWGIIHSNSSLFLLRHLHTLILSSNDFRGSTIPPEFGKFADLLHLRVWSVNLSGDIPLEISYLSKLQALKVFDENQQLRLNTSTFKRIVTNLTNLQNLTLYSVDMSRVDPASLMNLSSSLKSLKLWSYGLQGNSPNTIFHLLKLEILSLDGSENLTDSLPKCNWSSSLRALSLTNFLIDIPNLIRDLKSLEMLSLSNCRFRGSYPVLFGNLTQLTSIALSYNDISG